MTRSELDALVEEDLLECSDDQRAFFEAVRIPFTKWTLSPWGHVGGGFWIVAVHDGKALWFNDIEEGFNVSAFRIAGVIPEDGYYCNQDPLAWALPRLQGELGLRLAPPRPVPGS